jgi:hypothetical protein
VSRIPSSSSTMRIVLGLWIMRGERVPTPRIIVSGEPTDYKALS